MVVGRCRLAGAFFLVGTFSSAGSVLGDLARGDVVVAVVVVVPTESDTSWRAGVGSFASLSGPFPAIKATTKALASTLEVVTVGRRIRAVYMGTSGRRRHPARQRHLPSPASAMVPSSGNEVVEQLRQHHRGVALHAVAGLGHVLDPGSG